MDTALPREQKRKPLEPEYKFGIESNGILMTPQELEVADIDDFDPLWDYELINGLLIVSPISMEEEADSNDELGYLLRQYHADHLDGRALDKTLPRQYVKCGNNRRKVDRVIWAGLGRLPRRWETPTALVEFVSNRKRDRELDYETKRKEYASIKVQEYWIIDRFRRHMSVYLLDGSVLTVNETQPYRTKLLPGFELPLARLLALADQ